MDGTSSRQCYTREDVMGLLDGGGDLDIDDHNLDDIFYPGVTREDLCWTMILMRGVVTEGVNILTVIKRTQEICTGK